MREHQDVKSLPLVGAPQNVLQDGLLHCTDIAREDLLEDRLDLLTEALEQCIWDEVQRSLHPLFPKLCDFLVANRVWGVNILEEPASA